MQLLRCTADMLALDSGGGWLGVASHWVLRTSSGGGVLLWVSTTLLVVTGQLLSITDVETKTGKIDVAVSPDKKSTEDWLGENIEDTVEYSLTVRGDDVTALR